MKRLFRDNYFITADRRYLLGNFNSHLERNQLFVLDEATWAGDKDADPLLKKLITGDTVTIERKGLDAYTVDSYCRLMILSNESWVIPATDGERRYSVFDVLPNRVKDRVFFGEMMDSMRAGGDRYLLTQLQKYKIISDVFNAPETDGLLTQKERSLDPNKSYWLDCLVRGENIENGSEGVWVQEIEVRVLSNQLRNYYSAKNIRSRIPTDAELIQIFLHIEKKATVENGVIHFPELDECRKSWDKHLGQKRKW
jgi:hypothetical protein